MALGGCGRAERQCGRERQRGVQKPLAACQGKTVPGVGAIVQWLERLTNTVGARARLPGSWGGGWRAAAVLCLVAECSAALSVLENCSRKNFGRYFR
jgi:hypothetical protein